MSSVYSPTAVSLGNITIPDDGDTIEAADVNVPFEALADGIADLDARTGHLTRLVKGCAVKAITPSAISPVASSPTLVPYAASDLLLTRMFANIQVVNTGTAAAHGFAFPFDSHLHGLHGHTLTSAVIKYQGAAGHGGLPAVLPRFGVFRVAFDFNGASDLSSAGGGFVVDAPASVPAYQASHTWTFTANQNNVIDLGAYSYFVMFYYEGHTNALVGGLVSGFQLTFTK